MTPEIELRDERGGVSLKKLRIGLALSGGGFRASLFHLGVIRRLEELGIMKDVDVISSVSGGSIVSAYYVREMERHLRRRSEAEWHDRAVRVELFERIAADFLRAMDHNLRTRALVFAPFFHPLLFLKTTVLRLRKVGARSELIQREYDKWFYHEDTLDQLPSVSPELKKSPIPILAGPELILNTTSLLTGERVSFSREPNSGMTEMKRPNKNSLPISRIVGASSGVPVLFPPTHVYGDMLVDGGVADNQGIEALLDGDPLGKPDAPDLVLVSDASGQLEALHTLSSSEATVFFRVNSILQSQVRSKLIDRLVEWRRVRSQERFFAYTHLFLNLKDRGTRDRLWSELIPNAARIRTDLDQFSFIEREALMYHGYTLIDAQLRKYCAPVIEAYEQGRTTPTATPPMFSDEVGNRLEKRDQIRRELEMGSKKIFLYRSFAKYPRLVALALAGWLGGMGGALALLFGRYRAPLEKTQVLIETSLNALTPSWLGDIIDWVLLQAGLPLREPLYGQLADLGGALLLVLAVGYALAFPTYRLVRFFSMTADRRAYRNLTGTAPTTQWVSGTVVEPNADPLR